MESSKTSYIQVSQDCGNLVLQRKEKKNPKFVVWTTLISLFVFVCSQQVKGSR